MTHQPQPSAEQPRTAPVIASAAWNVGLALFASAFLLAAIFPELLPGTPILPISTDPIAAIPRFTMVTVVSVVLLLFGPMSRWWARRPAASRRRIAVRLVVSLAVIGLTAGLLAFMDAPRLFDGPRFWSEVLSGANATELRRP